MRHPEDIGAYHILEVLGEGGFGVVYRAEHRTPGIAARQGQVVVKTLHPHLAAIAEYRERFEREADLLAVVDHPGVVKLIDLISENETVALVLAHVPGEELTTQMHDWRDPKRLLGLLESLAAILDHLHDLLPEPVVHRDLKPSNVLVSDEGRPVLIDFGIARAGSSEYTRTGAGMGTIHYMAPEQYTDAKRVDGRADIYALGMIAFQLLTGDFPWETGLSDYRVLQKKDTADLDLTRARDAEGVFRQVLDPLPEERFQRASAFVVALTSALPRKVSRPPVIVTTVPPTQRWSPPQRPVVDDLSEVYVVDNLQGIAPDEVRWAILEAFGRLEIRTRVTDFRLPELVEECAQSGYRQSTIRTFVTARMCVNSPNPEFLLFPDLERVGRGTYRRIGSLPDEPEPKPFESKAPPRSLSAIMRDREAMVVYFVGFGILFFLLILAVARAL